MIIDGGAADEGDAFPLVYMQHQGETMIPLRDRLPGRYFRDDFMDECEANEGDRHQCDGYDPQATSRGSYNTS